MAMRYTHTQTQSAQVSENTTNAKATSSNSIVAMFKTCTPVMAGREGRNIVEATTQTVKDIKRHRDQQRQAGIVGKPRTIRKRYAGSVEGSD